MARSSGGKIVTDGLVLALDAGNDKSYPGTGTTWTDLSGNGNNGTLVNGVSTQAGDGNLNYTLVNYSGGHPSNTAGLTNVFTVGTNVQTGIHTGNIAWGSSGQSIRWGGTVGTYPSYHTRREYFGWKVEGFIYLPETGNYQFLIDGDDACDFFIDGQLCSYWYGGHGFGTGATGTTKYFISGWYTFEARMEEQTGGDGIAVGWKKPSDSSYQTIPSTAFSTKKTGRSLVFDGVDDYVNLPNNDDVRLTTNSWSIGIFFKGTNLPTSFPGYIDTLYTSRGSSPNYGLNLAINNQSGLNRFSLIDRQGTNGDLSSSNNSYKPNTWQYLVFTKNNTEGNIYIDGNLDASNNTQPTTYTSDTNPRLGKQILYSSYNYTGNISQVLIYNRALTADEVAQNFNATRNRFGI